VAETSDPMMAAPAQGPGLMAQAAPASPEGLDADTDTFETMVAGLIEFIYGQGQKGIAKQLKSAKNLPQTVGMVTLQLVKTAADQATAAGREFDLDMILGCATEIIDSLFQMARALKLDVGDPEQAGAEALFVAIQAYQASTPPGSEEQEAAKAMPASVRASCRFSQTSGRAVSPGRMRWSISQPSSPAPQATMEASRRSFCTSTPAVRRLAGRVSG